MKVENIISEREIVINGARVYYQICGMRERIPLLFFHGWPGYLIERTDVLQTLAKYFFVIAPMHPGLRKSDPLPSYYNIFEQYADVAQEIIIKEGMGHQSIIVMGQSFGGAVASAYAERHHQTTRCLILTDSVMGASRSDWWSSFRFGRGAQWIDFLPRMPRFVQRILLFFVYGVTIRNKAEWASVRNTFPARMAMTRNVTQLINNAKRSGVMVIDRKYGSFPIILVWGDRDGKEFSLYGYCPIDDAEAFYRKLKQSGKNAYFITVHGGHIVLYTKPHYVIGEIIKVLTSIGVVEK